MINKITSLLLFMALLFAACEKPDSNEPDVEALKGFNLFVPLDDLEIESTPCVPESAPYSISYWTPYGGANPDTDILLNGRLAAPSVSPPDDDALDYIMSLEFDFNNNYNGFCPDVSPTWEITPVDIEGYSEVNGNQADIHIPGPDASGWAYNVTVSFSQSGDCYPTLSFCIGPDGFGSVVVGCTNNLHFCLPSGPDPGTGVLTMVLP